MIRSPYLKTAMRQNFGFWTVGIAQAIDLARAPNGGSSHTFHCPQARQDRPAVKTIHLASQGTAPRERHRLTSRPRPDRDHTNLLRHTVDDQGRQP